MCLFSDSCSRVPCCLIKSILLYKVYETKDNMKSIVAFGFVLLVTEKQVLKQFSCVLSLVECVEAVLSPAGFL